MYLVDALTVLVRRWYVVLAGVLLLGAGSAAVIAYVPTEYQSSGQMVFLLPPGASGTEKPVNPYLNLQAGLTTAASLVSGAASTKDVEEEMADEGFDSEYAVAVVPGTGPLITVTTKDNDPEMATATRDAMMAWIDVELRRIQEEVGTPQAQYMSATRSSVSQSAEALPGSKLRALAALGAVLGLLTLVMTFGTDRMLSRRAARRAGRADSGPRDTDEVPVAGDPADQDTDEAGEGAAPDVIPHHTDEVPAEVPAEDAPAGPREAGTPKAVTDEDDAAVEGRSASTAHGPADADGLVLTFHAKRPQQQVKAAQSRPRRDARANRRGSRR